MKKRVARNLARILGIDCKSLFLMERKRKWVKRCCFGDTGGRDIGGGLPSYVYHDRLEKAEISSNAVKGRIKSQHFFNHVPGEKRGNFS